MLGLMLQWGVWGGFSFTDFLNQLESLGFFQYLLPFLLIFALVYAIITEIPIFKEKRGPAVIIALAVGLLSLQLDFVPAFFQSVFPNFGIGLSILLIGLILAGAFLVGKTEGSREMVAFKWIFFGLGALIFVIVTVVSLSDISFVGSNWWNAYGGLIVVLLVIAGVIVAVVLGNKKEGT